ncbi:MAG: aldehyde dehydrogenase family protein, partial [Proteobacteria bacterium]|nr:aldehyde dehydrogenase family protein [Pseudomonadota bacterium]
MANARSTTPIPRNEPVLSHAPGSPERADLQLELKRQSQSELEIPLVIGTEKIFRNEPAAKVVSPHNHRHQLARYTSASSDEISAAIKAALLARKEWAALAWEERAAVFLKAAELLAGKYRSAINAATMLGQSKTCHQAEIDASCELIDFFRFNVAFAERIYSEQPQSAPGMWNRSEVRGLEGFIYAVSPFNFTSIAINLPAAPALMGCTVLWKPAPSALLSNWIGLQALEEAGLPPGVINMVVGDPVAISSAVLSHPDLAGIHFTGSTSVFNMLWKTVGQNIGQYKTYPRLVGETGGKDFIFAHPSASVDELITGMVRGAFEFQGQKCSA